MLHGLFICTIIKRSPSLFSRERRRARGRASGKMPKLNRERDFKIKQAPHTFREERDAEPVFRWNKKILLAFFAAVTTILNTRKIFSREEKNKHG